MVVEGIKDQKALRLIGFEGDIVVLNNFRGITKFVDNMTIRKKKIILLLDMDHKGKILTSKILSHMNSTCRHDHLHAKQRLARITGGRLRHIEDLSTFSMAFPSDTAFTSYFSNPNAKKIRNDHMGFSRLQSTLN